MIKCKLGEILKVKHGYAFKSEFYGESNVTLVTLANISDKNSFKYNEKKATHYCAEYPSDFNLYPGDLVMPLTEQVIGLFGNTALIPEVKGIQFVLNQRVGKIIPLEGKSDLKFLHFLLATEHVKNQLEARASAGTKQRNISPEDIYDVEVEIPEYKDQKKIGEFLYNLENQINLNSKLFTNYKEYIDLLYNKWFLDFEFPDKQGKPYKSNGGKMVDNKLILTKVPDNWSVKTLDNCELLSLISTGINTFDGKKKYLATADVDNNSIKEGSFITYEDRESRANMQPIPNSIWFAKMKNSVKHITVCNDSTWLINDYIFSTGFMGFKCNNDSFAYIFAYINNNSFEKIKDMRSSGSTQEGINDGDLCLFPIIIPEKELLLKFSNLVDPMLKTMDKLIQCNKNIESYLKYILPIALSNQLKM